MASQHNSPDRARWTVHGERVVAELRYLRLSIAQVEMPDGTRFERYIVRTPQIAITVVLDGSDRVLMVWRYRFVIDRWSWELPGGYVDPGESAEYAAVREVEEETGWRPRGVTPLVSLQPSAGVLDAEHRLFVARGADRIGEPRDVNEAARVAWLPLSSVRELIAEGQIVGAATQVGLLHVLAFSGADSS